MYTILIVEDDNILSKAINAALISKGFKTIVACDGKSALSTLKKYKIDLVLLDLILPKESGEEVLEEIRNDQLSKDIPVVVCSVKNDNETIARCNKLGISGYLMKTSYTLEKIGITISEILKKKA